MHVNRAVLPEIQKNMPVRAEPVRRPVITSQQFCRALMEGYIMLVIAFRFLYIKHAMPKVNTAAHQEPYLCCTDSTAVKEPKEYGARYPS